MKKDILIRYIYIFTVSKITYYKLELLKIGGIKKKDHMHFFFTNLIPVYVKRYGQNYLYELELNEAKFLFYIMHSVDILNNDSSKCSTSLKKKTLLALVLIEREDAALWLSSIKFLAGILLCNAGYRPRFNPCSRGIQQWQGNQIWPVQSMLRKERPLHVSKVCQ